MLKLGGKRGKFEQPMEAPEVESCPGFKQLCVLGQVVGCFASRLPALASRDGATVTRPGCPRNKYSYGELARGLVQRQQVSLGGSRSSQRAEHSCSRRCLLRVHSVLGTVLGARDTVVTKTFLIHSRRQQ